MHWEVQFSNPEKGAKFEENDACYQQTGYTGLLHCGRVMWSLAQFGSTVTAGCSTSLLATTVSHNPAS